MKKIGIFLVFLFLFPSFLTAQTLEEDRRIEEGKRDSLRPTETHESKSKAQPQSASPIVALDMIYFVELSLKRISFGYDACKVLVILMGVENQYIDLNSQVTFLKENKFLPKGLELEFDPMKPLRKGLAAYIFCKALDIKGGVILRLFGVSQRYALNELVYQGFMSAGNPRDIVSGEELVSILLQAVSHKNRK